MHEESAHGFPRGWRILAATALTLAAHAFAQAGQATGATARDAARDSFSGAHLGLFFRWGVYSLLEKGERVMDQDSLPVQEYAKLPPHFNPSRFDAEAWAALARAAGARHVILTAKDYDGFCMYSSDVTDYDIVDSTPYHADPLKALVAACRKHDLKIFLYYSLLDWHHPDYAPRGQTGQATKNLLPGTWKHYVTYYQAQVRELCKHYGPIHGFYLDGCWDRPDAAWDLEGTYRIIRELQPSALVAANRRGFQAAGEDIAVEEAVEDPGAAAPSREKGELLEMHLTINRSRGYDAADDKYKSVSDLARAYARSAARNSILVFELGPRPDGTIGPEFAQRLRELGQWLEGRIAAFEGARPGPIPPQPWGLTTARGPSDHPSAIYFHLFNLQGASPIVLEPASPWTPRILGRAAPPPLRATTRGIEVLIPDEARDTIDTIVVLEPKPHTPRSNP